MKGIIDLPTVRGSDPIQVLKLHERFKGNVPLTLDKLSGFKVILLVVMMSEIS